MDRIVLEPIGLIRTPFKNRGEAPHGPSSAHGAVGRVIVKPQYAAGLKDLAGFSHLILVCYFDRSTTAPLLINPERSPTERGVFATRSPDRPNHLGISVVRLDRVEDNILFVWDVDLLDETPLLDIKPYSPLSDPHAEIRQGWMDQPRPDRKRGNG